MLFAYRSPWPLWEGGTLRYDYLRGRDHWGPRWRLATTGFLHLLFMNEIGCGFPFFCSRFYFDFLSNLHPMQGSYSQPWDQESNAPSAEPARHPPLPCSDFSFLSHPSQVLINCLCCSTKQVGEGSLSSCSLEEQKMKSKGKFGTIGLLRIFSFCPCWFL